MAVVQTRLNQQTKDAADAHFAKLGTTTSSAIRSFISASLNSGKLLFPDPSEVDLDKIPGIKKPKHPLPFGIAIAQFANGITKEGAQSLNEFLEEYEGY